MPPIDRLKRFLDRLRTLREVQREFRRTQDSRLRNQLPGLELALDNDVELLAAELRAAAIAAEAEASAASSSTELRLYQEGGAA